MNWTLLNYYEKQITISFKIQIAGRFFLEYDWLYLSLRAVSCAFLSVWLFISANMPDRLIVPSSLLKKENFHLLTSLLPVMDMTDYIHCENSKLVMEIPI